MFGIHKRIILCHQLNFSIKPFLKCSSFLPELLNHHLPQRRSVSSSCHPLEYELIEQEHYDQVLEHLRRNFFLDEPTNKAADLCQNGSPCTHPELEQKALETMPDHLSLMAVETQQDCSKIAGVVLNGILRDGDTVKALKDLDRSCDLGYRKMFTMIYSFNIKNDLFKEFAVDRIFDVRVLSVDSSYRGRGIANELVKQSVALAKQKGFSLLKTDATGIFSQKIFKSLGFEVFAEQPYDKYMDDDGQIILPVEAPHTKLQLLYKKMCKGTENEQGKK